METNSLVTDPLKYNIKLKLASLTEPQRMKVQKKVRAKHKLGQATYSRYINARRSNSTDIPGEVLLYFADCLHCTVDDLYNND
jgi:hypothetical protein